MIPRRRVPISAYDVAEWLRSPLRSRERSAEDVASFERAFTEYLGCGFARATTSGRDCIELALGAVGVASGDEVIVPAYTLGELMPLLQARGLTLIPADIEEDTFNIDPRRIAERITPRTKAILATHLLGAPCDIEAICGLARERGVAVVEDCAHGLGADVSGRKVGTFGDAAIFSLEVNKAVPTYGGGVVVTNDAKAAEAIAAALDSRPRNDKPALKKAFSSWLEEGMVRSPFYSILARILFSERFAARFEQMYRGGHDRLRAVKPRYSGFQARLGLRRLGQLDRRNERLNERWEAMAKGLPEGFVRQARDRVGRPAFYNFVALSPIPPRELRKRVMRRGVDIGVGSEVMDECARMLGFEDCPVAASVSERAVLLPLYDGLSQRRFRRVIRALEEAVRGEAR